MTLPDIQNFYLCEIMCEKLNHGVPFWVETFIDNMAHLYLEEKHVNQFRAEELYILLR